MKLSQAQSSSRQAIPDEFHSQLIPVAKRVFWWGIPQHWMDDSIRFAAQVMTYGDWDDTTLAIRLLGEDHFQRVLINAPPGVFDIKSWTYWHHRYLLRVPPLPVRRL